MIVFIPPEMDIADSLGRERLQGRGQQADGRTLSHFTWGILPRNVTREWLGSEMMATEQVTLPSVLLT